MCGIYGLVRVKGPKPVAEEWRKMLAALGALSCVRGTDSAGIARADSDGIAEIVKDAVPAWELVRSPLWNHAARPGTFAIGHTRFATHGSVCQKNAHPFGYRGDDGSETCAVHNGMISNHQQLVTNGAAHDVDSANLIAALAGYEPKHYREVLRKTVGTLALAIIHKPARGNGKLILTRRGNPLYLCRVAGLQAIAFASTEDILKKALAACHMASMGNVWQIKEGVLYIFDGKRAKPVKVRWQKKPVQRSIFSAHEIRSHVSDILQTYAESGRYFPDYEKKTAPFSSSAGGKEVEEWAACGACLHYFRTDELAVLRGIRMCPECVFAAQHAFSYKALKGGKAS